MYSKETIAFRIQGAPVCQKLDMMLGNKVAPKLKLEKNVLSKNMVS